MDNFKPFNDIYGFPTGDKAIRMLASIVDDAVKKAGNLDDFIGHGGGDDFVVITSPEKASAIAESVITDFDEQISSLYQEEDLRRGYSIYIDRSGGTTSIPIMTRASA